MKKKKMKEKAVIAVLVAAVAALGKISLLLEKVAENAKALAETCRGKKKELKKKERQLSSTSRRKENDDPFRYKKAQEELAREGLNSQILRGPLDSSKESKILSFKEGESCDERKHSDYTDAFASFVEEVNKRKSRPRKISFYASCINLQTLTPDPEKYIILVEEHKVRKFFLIKVYYKNDTKDGSPRVSLVKTADQGKEKFSMQAATQKRLSPETLVKSILSVLKKKELLPYCERVYNTIAEEGEAVFNALVALKISEKEFLEKYGTENLQKAWVTALAKRFGGDTEQAVVTPKEDSVGCYRIKFAS